MTKLQQTQEADPARTYIRYIKGTDPHLVYFGQLKQVAEMVKSGRRAGTSKFIGDVNDVYAKQKIRWSVFAENTTPFYWMPLKMCEYKRMLQLDIYTSEFLTMLKDFEQGAQMKLQEKTVFDYLDYYEIKGLKAKGYCQSILRATIRFQDFIS